MSLLKIFIDRHRSIYDAAPLLNDLSTEQRREALLAALAEWSEAWPRLNQSGYARAIAGKQFIYLPIDYLRAEYNVLNAIYRAAANTGNSNAGEIIPTTLNSLGVDSFLGYGGGIGGYGVDPFDNQLGATRYPPGYDQSYPQAFIPITDTDRGRKAFDLGVGSTAPATGSLAITYDAIHQIADEGKLIAMTALPADGNTLQISGGTSYTFRTAPSLTGDIQIATDIYTQGEFIADRLVADDQADAESDLDTIRLRPVTLGAAVTVTTNVTGFTVSRLPAMNTVNKADQWKVFALLMYHLMAYKDRAVAIAEEANDGSTVRNPAAISQNFASIAQREYARVKPYLHVS